MPKYKIPDIFIPGFNELSSLKDKDLKIIISKINSLKVGEGPEHLATVLGKSKISHGVSVYEISITLFSLVNLIEEDDIPNIEVLLDDLIASYKEQAETSDNINPVLLKVNLLQLLTDISKLNLTIKAIKVRTEFDKVYLKSRIFTDARVVFDKEIKNKDQFAVVIHNLHIEYKKNGVYKKLFLALDNGDLRDLKEQIERAEEKETSLKKNNKISFIEIKE